MKLYHYTCEDHGALGINRVGSVHPNWHWLLGEPLAWFTDLAEPDALALGLTSETLDCDRTRVRFEVVCAESCVPWHRFARDLARDVRDDMECPPGLPRHWWVSREPVPVLATASQLTRGADQC